MQCMACMKLWMFLCARATRLRCRLSTYYTRLNCTRWSFFSLNKNSAWWRKKIHKVEVWNFYLIIKSSTWWNSAWLTMTYCQSMLKNSLRHCELSKKVIIPFTIPSTIPLTILLTIPLIIPFKIPFKIPLTILFNIPFTILLQWRRSGTP